MVLSDQSLPMDHNDFLSESFLARIHVSRTIPFLWTVHPCIGNRVKIINSLDRGQLKRQNSQPSPGRGR